jgi:hypothetical protein
VVVEGPEDGPGVEIAFADPAQLETGALYHVVFENVSEEPAEDFVSVNGLFVYEEQPVWQPAFANVDWAHLVRTPERDWSDDRGPGRGTITPIMGLQYADGTVGGMGYMEVWYREPQSVSGDRRVRQIFTVDGPDRLASSVSVRLKRVSGEDPLRVVLRHVDGDVVAEGEVPAERIAIADPAENGGSTWATLEFASPATLRSGETYRLQLSTVPDTEYSIFAIREGGSHGYGPATFFAAGRAEFRDGTTWRPFIGFGTPSVQGDLQFYFEAPVEDDDAAAA